MPKKPFVDQDECIGCGVCEEACPDVFRLNDKGLAEVHDPVGASVELIQEAIDGCPVDCISWVEK